LFFPFFRGAKAPRTEQVFYAPRTEQVVYAPRTEQMPLFDGGGAVATP
jgi:hypothetical protein